MGHGWTTEGANASLAGPPFQSAALRLRANSCQMAVGAFAGFLQFKDFSVKAASRLARGTLGAVCAARDVAFGSNCELSLARIEFVHPSISDMNVAASEIGRDGPR